MRKGKLFPLSSPCSVIPYKQAIDYRVESTGEYRCPNKGEWFISGSIPKGYVAPCDLGMKYNIGILVKVEVKTIVSVIREPYKFDEEGYALCLDRHALKQFAIDGGWESIQDLEKKTGVDTEEFIGKWFLIVQNRVFLK